MGLESNIKDAFLTNLSYTDNQGKEVRPAENDPKINRLAKDISSAIRKFITAQTFTIEDAECTINIPPVVSTVVGVGGLFPGPVSGTATSPPIIANAVIKSAALGTPSNASPLASVKSQQSKVQLLEQNVVDG